MNVVFYLRYSSDAQREESIEGQLRDCTAYANYNGMTVVGTYIDRALSAKTDNRPQFQKMIKDSSKKMFEAIIVWKLDRFARNRYDSAYYKNILKKNGVKVISAMERVSEGAEGIILESVLEGYAEYYSVELAEKVNRGMKDNALKCMNNGAVTPMGYYVDDEQHLQIDETKAPFVVEIFERFNNGNKMADIIKDMNARGVGVTMRVKRSKKTRENPLNFNIIRRMLSNRKYIGEYKFKDVVVPHGVPQIISNELFDRVQKKLELNKKAPGRHKAPVDYLLTTKLFCGKCKAIMYGESGTSRSGTKYNYYKCLRAKKFHDCDKKTVKKDWIENLVVNSVKEKIMDNALMEQLSYRLYDLQMNESNTLNSLKAKLNEVNAEIENVMTAIKKGIILDTTKKALEELEERQKQLEIDITTEEIKSPILTQEQILFLLTKFRSVDISTEAGKRAIIDGFINKVYLFDDKVVITCNYKDEDIDISFADIENSGILSDNSISDENAKTLDKISKNDIKKLPEHKCSDNSKIGDPNGI